MFDNFSHIQMIRYNIQIGDTVTPKVAMFNCNKLPTGVAIKCIESDTYNDYLITMTQAQFEALFLDDASLDAPNAPLEEVAEPEDTQGE